MHEIKLHHLAQPESLWFWFISHLCQCYNSVWLYNCTLLGLFLGITLDQYQNCL